MRNPRFLPLVLHLSLVLGWIALTDRAFAQDREVEKAVEPFNPNDPSQVAKLLEPFRKPSEKWEDDVAIIIPGNSKDGGPEHILFLGSSSFRRWDSIAQDMSNFHVVRRAYGGAKYRDLAIHTPALIRGLQFAKAVVFIANDITGKEDDTDPEVVAKLARVVVNQLHREQPKAEVFLLAVTPTPSRYHLWPRIQKTNAELKAIADSTERVYYIPTAYAFLDQDGIPKAQYFVEDKLHPNEAGYQVWSKIIAKALQRDPGSQPEVGAATSK